MFTTEGLTSASRKRAPQKGNPKPGFPIADTTWLLLMLFAKLETVECCICSFIVVWEAITMIRNSSTTIGEFNEEISDMIHYIDNSEIDGDLKKDYSQILDDYRGCRQSQNNNDLTLKKNLVNGVWVVLEENYGLRNSHAIERQIKALPPDYNKQLRKLVLTRMESFHKETAVRKDDKEGIIKDEDILRERISAIMDKGNSNGNDLNKSSKAKKSKGDEGDKSDKSLLKEIEDLKTQMATLVKENSQQQAALGNLTNLSWNEEDPNSATKLISNIEELQDMLSDFTMVQGSDYEIIDTPAKQLLKDYGCNPKSKLSLGTILQRHVITMIVNGAQRYLKNAEGNTQTNSLERDIIDATDKLIKYTELFRDNRKGDDDITKITPTRIRQHAYSALSCRGFSGEHPLVKQIANELLAEMNKYRRVVDKETNDELQDQAIQITNRVINLFCFRLKTQASEPSYKFFEAGHDIDTRLMQGSFGRENTKRMELEACGFPCIGIFDETNQSNQKVYTKAQVIPKPKNK